MLLSPPEVMMAASKLKASGILSWEKPWCVSRAVELFDRSSHLPRRLISSRSAASPMLGNGTSRTSSQDSPNICGLPPRASIRPFLEDPREKRRPKAFLIDQISTADQTKSGQYRRISCHTSNVSPRKSPRGLHRKENYPENSLRATMLSILKTTALPPKKGHQHTIILITARLPSSDPS